MGSVVVVGAGIAGVRTVQGLVRRGHAGTITVIGAEHHPPYDRPPLSKEVLHGDARLPALLPAASEVGPNVEWRTGVTALALDTSRQQLVTDRGTVHYDTLVIATGALARRLPGLPGDVLRTWDDAVKLRTQLEEGASVTIIGAGLVGCEVAASARKMGAEVHLVDVLSAPMTRVAGPALASVISELHRAHGVNLHLSTSVSKAARRRVYLSDGTTCPADVLLHAVGSVPDTAWLADSGLDITDGVRCDKWGRTQATNVYAVGDVAAWGGIRSEHWSSAIDQANAVADDITGQQRSELPLPYWWSDQYEVRFQGLGTVGGADEVRVRAWGPENQMVALYGRSGRLCGVLGLSAAKTVMGLRRDVSAGVLLEDAWARFDDMGHGLGGVAVGTMGA